jgi:hypothetical protein
MAVAHIRKPADFTLPANPDQLIDALQTLPTDEQRAFSRELLEAMGQVKPSNDFRPVGLVLERWYRFALLKQHPAWPHAIEQADAIRRGELPEDVHQLDPDQLRREVDRRRRARSA